MACGSDSAGKWKKEELSVQLNCPVCLEVYKTPRSLTCLHTFCEGCITSFLLEAVKKGSVTSIPCPLCRQHTDSPAPAKPPAEWARELPLNTAITPMLGVTESESTKQCGNCAKRKTQRPAQNFCVECNDFLCPTCVEYHNAFAFMESHRMLEMTATEIPRHLNLGRLEVCTYHNNKMLEFFCEDHDTCCCSTCAIVKHRGCTAVKELTELGRKLKDGDRNTCTKMTKGMDAIEKQLEDFLSDLQTNLLDIERQAEDIPKRIKDIRAKIVQMLDELVDKVTSECCLLKKQQTTDIEDRLTSIRAQEAAVNTSRLLVEALMEHGTESQMFVGFRKVEEQMKQYEGHVEEVRRSLVSTELHLTLSEALNNLTACSSLAQVSVQQNNRYPPVPIADCEVKMSPIVRVQKRDNMQQPAYNGAQLLLDGRVVASDFYNELVCFLDDDFFVTSEVKLQSNPRDMVLMGKSEAVVVLPFINQLQRVSVGTGLSLNGTIPCKRKPRCVSRVSDTELAVGWDRGLSIIHLDGTEKFYMDKDSSGRQIQFCENSRLMADTVSSRLYQSSWGDHAVYGMEMTGKALFTYTNNLKHPAGLALDRDRNLYVCSRGSRSVHQVGPDGQGIRIIDVGFDNPWVIYFDHSGTQMTVIQYYNTTKIKRISFEPKSH